jgi:signal transduction histidine kinase
MSGGNSQQTTSFISAGACGDITTMKYLHPRNWSKYSRRLSGNQEALRFYKRTILLSQFTLFGAIVGILHALEDIADGLRFMPMMDFIMVCGIMSCYFLNEAGRHKLSKIVLLSFLNIFFFVYSSLAPREIGIYLYYFPWVGLAAVVFEIHENMYKLFFIVLSVVFLITLFVTDFNIFGTVKYQPATIGGSFVINLISSIGVLVFFIVFMSNMNEYSERRLIDLAKEIRVKNTDLQKANRELDRFFYSTSHDLKVPLMDMKGVINTAMAEVQDEKVLTYFLLLNERAQKLDNFLQDVIDYARNAQMGLRLGPVNIAALIEEVFNNFQFTKGADKIRIQRDISLNYLIETDPVRLMIVLNNILSNAIKYHRLELKNPWILVAAYYENSKLHFTISDNGQGIEDDLLPKIFNMFFRGTNQSKGSGLGLYIVKETIAKMGGTIHVESTYGSGSSFIISIPATLTTIPVESKARLSMMNV